MSDEQGIIHTALHCKRCDATEEYFISPDNWPNGIECSKCERNGPFAVAGDGVVEFTDIQSWEIELQDLEQIQYTPPDPESYEPPEGHYSAGAMEWVHESGPKSTIPENATLIQAYDSDVLDEQEAERKWEDVRELFDSTENGMTTRAYTRAAKILSDIESFAAIRESEALWYYREDLGYYVRKGETFIGELLMQYIPGYMNTNRERNITEMLRNLNYVSSDKFNPPTGKVNVENGVLDLETRELEAHNPDYYFTSRLQTPYDPDAEAELWNDFLLSSVGAESEAKKLMEFVGYSLETWHHNREKNLFVVGPSQSGKSTFADTIQALYGDAPTVTNLTPQQLADTQFDAASLQDAMLNAVNDINASKIENSGALKRLLSGERMKMERKHKDAHFKAPNAKHMYTANWLPVVVGQDESLYRRVLLVEFPNQVPDEERDETLKTKLQSEDVLSAILNGALDARDRLHDQGGFTNDRNREETRKKWDSWRDAHKRFLYTQFDITGDSEHTVTKDAYYQAYKEFAGSEGYELKAQQGVTKSLKWVPEIAVLDESYAGLNWEDYDAADQNTLDEPSQNKRVELVTAQIGLLTANDAHAKKEDIVANLATQFDVEKIEQTLDKLLQEGQVYEPQEDCFALT